MTIEAQDSDCDPRYGENARINATVTDAGVGQSSLGDGCEGPSNREAAPNSPGSEGHQMIVLSG
ncbi:hypothetical protein [Arthrobacter vasquezii]|uniref:hypothetical protein n=1 Tax=Arthrobacter vasquezii TaxID=2977629 RepID=UPI0023F68E02|nr:hypothetical protein [Arthrobacter vasquezii]